VPKVTFVNEHRIVEAAAGSRVLDVAREAGVALDVARFRGALSCGGHGVCRACLCWVEEGAPGAAGPRSWMERLRGLRGWRRLACRARVVGDLNVYSIPAAANRVGQPRLIAEVPSPVLDPSAPRKPDDAASTAAHVHGHPSAVGRGTGGG
jgi:ferredoxin